MTDNDPVHHGEHLAEILDELGISQYRLAKTIGTPPRRINEIVHGFVRAFCPLLHLSQCSGYWWESRDGI